MWVTPVDKKLLNEFSKWVKQLEHLNKIKINQSIIEGQKTFPKLLNPRDKIKKSNTREIINERELSLRTNIDAIKTLIIIDQLLQVLKSDEVDATIYTGINDLMCFLDGIYVGMFKIAQPILSRNYKNIVHELHSVVRSYRNQKGKEWRDRLFELAIDEYNQDPLNTKTTALKRAFEKLPEKEAFRKEFDTYFDSIYRKFTTLFN